jgi:putative membrane protein
MYRTAYLASAVALALAMPAAAQVSTATSGSMTAADTGMMPNMAVSATDYVKRAADADMYEIASSKLAMTRTKRDDVRAYAKEMVADHGGTTKALKAALVNADRSIARPSTTLSSEKKAQIDLLRKAPRDQFDTLYLQQQADAHQKAWALHKGYATYGTDPALKQVASTAVPVIERHLMYVKGLLPAAMGGQ